MGQSILKLRSVQIIVVAAGTAVAGIVMLFFRTGMDVILANTDNGIEPKIKCPNILRSDD